jgi:phosphate transport system permease protein
MSLNHISFNIRPLKNTVSRTLMKILTLFTISFVFIIGAGLFLRSQAILWTKPLSELLFSSSWYPLKGKFGLLPFIMGTLWVTGIAAFIAVPLSILSAIYLSEYAHGVVLKISKPLIDLLAGIPSVVFGLWGVLVIVPFVKNILAPPFTPYSSGYTLVTGGIVLAIMIVPVMIHVMLEVFQSIPKELREAAFSLGATKWETIKLVVLRKARPGIIAAVILGFSRAFGETMAVMMVCGNVAKVPLSLFDPGYPLPALIANNYGEMLSIPLYDSALLLASFILFIVILVFNALSRIILSTIERRVS